MQTVHDDAIHRIERPDRSLLTYYLLTAIIFPPAFPFVVLPLYFRYHTMRYRFTEEGLSMSWGILFRREIILTYSRIQDIHLRSNIVERWLGLSRVLIQTASGNSGAEMTLEGLKEFEAVRDYLYSKMRGVKDPTPHAASVATSLAPVATNPVAAPGGDDAELATTLREVAAELRALRQTLAERQPPSAGSSHV